MNDAVMGAGFAFGVTGLEAVVGYPPTTISADLRKMSLSAAVGGEVLFIPLLPDAVWEALLAGLTAPRRESALEVRPAFALSRRTVDDPFLNSSIFCTSGSLPSPTWLAAATADPIAFITDDGPGLAVA